jgi:hypothetical protein
VVAGDTRQVTALGPAAVAVHNDRDVFGQAAKIDFLKKLRFFAIGGSERLDCFHGESLKERPRAKVAQRKTPLQPRSRPRANDD